VQRLFCSLPPADQPARRHAAQDGGKVKDEKPNIEEDRSVQVVEQDETVPITKELVTDFEERVKLYQERLLPAVLRATSPTDWVKMGDKYYLQATGVEKVAVPLGIEWPEPKVTKHDIGGGHYEYEVSGEVYSKFLRRKIWATGNCDSRDRFLTAQSGWDEGSIRKAAQSNFEVNAITRLAGIRNPTLDMLKRAGINPGAVGNVDYSGNKSSEEGKQVISDAQGKRLYAISRGRNMTDEDVKKVIAREPWKYGSTKDITRGHYEAICKAVETWEPEREPGSDG
jgi:hypothetical protein